MSSHSSRESLNSRESKENTPRHSRESTPQHQIKGSDPEFKKPQPIGIKNNRKREEMGVLGHNNNSNIKSNNDLGGSCGSLSSNHSTGTGLSFMFFRLIFKQNPCCQMLFTFKWPLRLKAVLDKQATFIIDSNSNTNYMK